jgi:cellulose synthase/poly-beta-1,6-N-acetylglucosamine synthase-like glycosyltransferase
VSWFELAIVVMIFYMVLIHKFQKGWKRLKSFKGKYEGSISVVIAARNEEETIAQLLTDLAQQTITNFEVIVVDDHSTDQTAKIAQGFDFVTLLKAEAEGKKAAVAQGVAHAKNDIVITTDADCRLPKEWLEKMLAPFAEEDIQLVVGPVAFSEEQNYFEKGQSLEFMSLIGSGAGAIATEKAFMCNAASLAFRKSIFSKTSDEIVSGDDVFLLHHIKKEGGEIAFVKEQSAIVTTSAKENWKSLLQQRQRWAAKSSSYTDKDAQYISWLVFLVNAVLLYAFFQGEYSQIASLLLLKSLVDYPFLKKLSQFFKKESLMDYYIPLQLVYPFYIVYVAVASQLGSFEWKGRKHSK